MTNQHSRELAPCGTPAAARRHYRHGEKLDEACRLVNGAGKVARRESGDPYAAAEPERQAPPRNGVPQVAYQYGASLRRPEYSWAVDQIRQAEAIYGTPEADDGASWSDREAC